ncbi:MAG: hypothetical protein OEM97_07765 [Acidimicrobiia bacterium]|nr:hypothetical protein [Acidimicrobiia bacterium]
MPSHVLLLGRTPFNLPETERELAAPGITLHAGTSLDDVREIMRGCPIGTVIMGAGLDLADRLAIVQYVFESSDATTVHMKDRLSGREGMIPFVRGVLRGLP